MSPRNRRTLSASALALGALALAALFLLPLAAPQAASGPKAKVPSGWLGDPDHPEKRPEGWTAPDQAAPLKLAHEPPQAPVTDIREESPYERREWFLADGPRIKDMKHTYFVLDSPLLKEDCGDHYGPVRFMHAKHAAALDQDCTRCHHAQPADAAEPATLACDACHQEAFSPEAPGRIGLKAAYHLQCMGCHEQMRQGPEDCLGCHLGTVPEHKDHITLAEGTKDPLAVTAQCLSCHPKAGRDMLTSAHWLWKGPSPFTVEHKREAASGKATNTLNNFCIAVPSNWPRCTSCHAGYGWKDADFDFSDPSRIDCLVCHDTTGTYKKAPPAAGMPDPGVDLVHVARNVGRTSRSTCGACHFMGGGGDAVKHADMSGVLFWPSRTCDVHMGGYDFQCEECHTTVNHKIHGRSTSLPVAEGSRSCEDCHTDKPHYGSDLMDHHLNKHCETLDCNVCHSPLYAKCIETKTWWDWSKAGDKQRKPVTDRYGMPDYNWKKGEFEWEESVKPEYAWYNGQMKRVLLGDAIDTDGVTAISAPVGGFKDPTARITPFKIMRGRQPADARNDYLLVPHLYPLHKDDTDAYWKGTDWQKAFAKGMQAAGLPYSGEYEWVDTEMYWAIRHEVMPAEMALSCRQCHKALSGERTCDRCHQDSRDVDFKKLAHKGTDFTWLLSKGRDVDELLEATDYIGFEALGYKGDPIVHGGRFTRLPLGYKADGE